MNFSYYAYIAFIITEHKMNRFGGVDRSSFSGVRGRNSESGSKIPTNRRQTGVSIEYVFSSISYLLVQIYVKVFVIITFKYSLHDLFIYLVTRFTKQ